MDHSLHCTWRHIQRRHCDGSAHLLELGFVATDDFYAPHTAAGTAPSEDAASAAVACGASFECTAIGRGTDRCGHRGRPHHPLHLQPGKDRLDAALPLAHAYRL